MAEEPMIEVREHGFSLTATPKEMMEHAATFRQMATDAGADWPTTINDWIFQMEVVAQNHGYLDEDFNPTDKGA